MRGWIPALRIARREARRARGRSALVLTMIGLPVAFLAFAAVTYDMFTLTGEERVERRMGSADALINWNTTAPVRQEPGMVQYGDGSPGTDGISQTNLIALLPKGSRAVEFSDSYLMAKTPGGVGQIHAQVGELTDPLMQGIAGMVEGTAPKAADEVALNRAAAKRFGVGVGQTITTSDPDRTFKITALVEYRYEFEPLMVLPPGAIEVTGSRATRQWLVDTPQPIGWTMIGKLNEHGMIVESRALEMAEQTTMPGLLGDPDTYVGGGVVAALVILEIVLMVGPAFAVGARRRARDLALIAAAGGEPKQLRRIVLADGVVLGVGGAIVGLVLGVTLAVIGRPLMEELTHSRAGGYRFFPLALVAIAGLAVGTGMLAAAVPAFVAARQSVVRVLAGRRGIVRSRKRWTALGIIVTATGVAAAFYGAVTVNETVIFFAVLLAALGIVLLTPALIGLIAKVGHKLPLGPRLALRDTARNRSSAAPAVSAIMAAVAGAVAIGVLVHADQRQRVDHYRQALPMGHVGITHYAEDTTQPDWAATEATVRRVLPSADVRLFKRPACPAQASAGTHCYVELVLPAEERCPELQGLPTEAEKLAAMRDPRCRPPIDQVYTFIRMVVDNGAALPALTNADPADIQKAREVLGRGGVVVTDPRFVKDGRVELAIHREKPGKAESPPTINVEGFFLRSGTAGVTSFVSPKVVAMAGLKAEIAGLVAATPMPTQAQQDGLNLIVQELGPTTRLVVERGPQVRPDPIGLALALAAAVIALAAAGIATGLTLAESRGALTTLAAVGAAPRVRRLLSLSQAGVISVLGTALGTVTGLGAAGILIFLLNRVEGREMFARGAIPFAMPWDTVAVIVAVPLLAMAGAGMMTRSWLPIERRL